MKRLYIILLTICVCIATMIGQSPTTLNYQGVLKHPDGSVRPDVQVTLTLEFLQHGVVVYRESHEVRTNANGYFAIEPGAGKALDGAFDDIDWGEGGMSMRSILDGEVIAESFMTAVPYAIYARSSMNDEVLSQAIDSVGNVLMATAIQLDDLIVITDSVAILTDSLSTTLRRTQLQVDTIEFTLDTLSHRIDTVASMVDSLTHEVTFFNATASAPPAQGSFHNRNTATQAVPQSLRREGLVVTYRTDSLNWMSLQYHSNDTSLWNNEASWKGYGLYGNLVIPYNESDSLTRLSIPADYRRQGVIISYFKGEKVVNEQYRITRYDNTSWCNDSSWLRLNLHLDELENLYNAIAQIDSTVKEVKKGLQDMSTFGSWFYIDHMELFSQAGYLDNYGERVSDHKMVSTRLIPLGDMWFISTYGSQEIPGISFYTDNHPLSRIPSPYDNLPSDTFINQTIDFSTDYIPSGAQYFSVNMHLDYKSQTIMKVRTPITNVIDASEKFSYKDSGHQFNYIGAYVGITGKRTLNTDYRHSNFIPIDNNHYKIITRGLYTEESTVPTIVYYRDPSFNACVGYELGEVQDDRSTRSEIVITAESVPENASYFIVNCKPSEFYGLIYTGSNNEELLLKAEDRINSLEINKSCYANRKLVTLGDSFTTNSGNKGKNWQQWLVDWLGVEWNLTETVSGANGFAPMGYGGAWVMPNDINSLSVRCRDVQRYSPNIILVYGGQNDKLDKYQLGSIDDEPFIPSQVIDLSKSATSIQTIEAAIQHIETYNLKMKSKTLIQISSQWGSNQLYYLPDSALWNDPIAWFHPIDSVSFYAAYKGVVELLCRNNPYATICCLTLMQCDESKYDSSMGNWEEMNAIRRKKCTAIEEIAQYYGVYLIDLWNKSGITPYNAASLYTDWLHPNQYGYRRLAECVYKHLK